MRILLDACLPVRLKRELTGHETFATRDRGWNGLDDGRLLEAMAEEFDVLITMDKSLRFQQQMQGRPFAVLLLRARSNRLPDLLPLMPAVLRALDACVPGEVVEIFR